jgi:hypothetical protein
MRQGVTFINRDYVGASITGIEDETTGKKKLVKLRKFITLLHGKISKISLKIFMYPEKNEIFKPRLV